MIAENIIYGIAKQFTSVARGPIILGLQPGPQPSFLKSLLNAVCWLL